MGTATTDQQEIVLSSLKKRAASLAERSHTPYSDKATGVALLLADGHVVPGVRVESASFSLLIPALVNAVTTAVASSDSKIVAGATNRPLRSWDRAYLEGPLGKDVTFASDDTFYRSIADDFPEITFPLPPFHDAELPESDRSAIHLARTVANRAYVPESSFHVGCVAMMNDGRMVPGVNVEHPDWSSILCAERNALGTCWSYGLEPPVALYLSCPDDAEGSPCGACRQLLTELMPTGKLCMDRGDAPPESVVPSALLPGSFTGSAIHSKL